MKHSLIVIALGRNQDSAQMLASFQKSAYAIENVPIDSVAVVLWATVTLGASRQN